MLQHVKANTCPLNMARRESSVKRQQRLLNPECWQPDVNSWKRNDIKMDFFIVFVPPSPSELPQLLGKRTCVIVWFLFSAKGTGRNQGFPVTREKSLPKFLFFSTNFSVRDLNDNTLGLCACDFTVVLVDCLLQAVVIFSILKTDSTTHEWYLNCWYQYPFCLLFLSFSELNCN